MGLFSTEKQRILALRAERLKALARSPEWEEFMVICQEEHKTLYKRLVEKEDPEARGAMKVIEKLLSRVSSEIRLGEQCRKELLDQERKHAGQAS